MPQPVSHCDFPQIKAALHACSIAALEVAVSSGESIPEFERFQGLSLIAEFIRLSRSHEEDISVPIHRLLKLGANVDAPVPHGISPLLSVLLHYSSEKNNSTDMLVSLLRAGADTEAHSIIEQVETGWRVQHHFSRLYPLGLAVQLGNIAAVEVLLLAGAFAEGPSDPDVTRPLSIAGFWKEDLLAEVLLSSGAKVDAKNTDGKTALHYCWDEKTANVLIQAGAQIKVVDQEGRLPLHEWCQRANTEQALQWLANIDPSTRFQPDHHGFSPLDLLKERCAKDVIHQQWLIPLVAKWESHFIGDQTKKAEAFHQPRRL